MKITMPQWNLETNHNNLDWWSKLTDGLLAAAVLFLVWLIVALADRPIQIRYGLPGLLVYALGLLAVAMFSLQQSLVSRRPDSIRAWYGVAGGLLAWSMVEVSADFGLPVIPSPAGLVILIMVSLTVALLWRHYLPIGARFFALTLLLNWAEMLLMTALPWLSSYSPVFSLVYRTAGYLALLGIVAALGWVMFKTRRRIQRISGALLIWFLGSVAMYVFRGSLF